MLEKHWNQNILVNLVFRTDRCGGQNINRFNMFWCGSLLVRFGIKRINFVTGPAGHNKFEVDGLFGSFQRQINTYGARTVWKLRDLASKIKKEIPNDQSFTKGVVIRSGFTDDRQNLLNIFNNGFFSGIKKWHHLFFELDEETLAEAKSLIAISGLPKTKLKVDENGLGSFFFTDSHSLIFFQRDSMNSRVLAIADLHRDLFLENPSSGNAPVVPSTNNHHQNISVIPEFNNNSSSQNVNNAVIQTNNSGTISVNQINQETQSTQIKQKKKAVGKKEKKQRFY